MILVDYNGKQKELDLDMDDTLELVKTFGKPRELSMITTRVGSVYIFSDKGRDAFKKNEVASNMLRKDGKKYAIKGNCLILEADEKKDHVDLLLNIPVHDGVKEKKDYIVGELLFIIGIYALRWLVLVGPFVAGVYLIGSILSGIFVSPFALGYGEIPITPAMNKEIWEHAFTNLHLATIIVMVIVGTVGALIVITKTGFD